MTGDPLADAPDVHVVDTQLLGMPGVMSAYLVTGERPALIDTGAAPAVEHVLDALEAHDVAPEDLSHIVPTHVHLDHAGAAGRLAAACPNATVAVHERGAEYLTDDDRLAALLASARDALGEDLADQYGEPTIVPEDRCRRLAGGDRLDLGDRSLDVVDAPGHAPHHLCLHDDRTDVLFAADAAGSWVAGDLYPTTPPPSFDLETSLSTLDRLRAREPSVICYGHFGARDGAVAAIEEYAALLPEWVAAVEAVSDETDDLAEMVDRLGREYPTPTIERDVRGALAYLEQDH